MSNVIQIGWASADITPEEPVLLAGQFYSRVSEAVMDPVTATALALSSGAENVIMVSCDLVSIPDCLRDAVREKVRERLPQLDPCSVCMNATHTHTGPDLRVQTGLTSFRGIPESEIMLDLPAMSQADCLEFVSQRIAGAIADAWNARRPGKIGHGVGQAVVGRNRRSSYFSGVSRMYGDTSDPDFSHVEGYEEHTVNLMATWDLTGTLTGLIVNVACPSQVSEHAFEVSADYWHDTRLELRSRLGDGLYVLPQCAAAGDQSPHIQVNKKAEDRMLRLAGRTPRQEIATRLSDAVCAALPFIEQEQFESPVLQHRVETVQLSRRMLNAEDVEEAMAEVATLRVERERLYQELQDNPGSTDQARWYVPVSQADRRMRWLEAVKARYEQQAVEPELLTEVHVVRVGDVVFATNQFELYLDFGLQIQTQSKAAQTFIVQLAGPGTYLPTRRAIEGRSYGAVPASTPIGPEGGRELVEWTRKAISEIWEQ